MTIFSPYCAGRLETRMSTVRGPRSTVESAVSAVHAVRRCPCQRGFLSVRWLPRSEWSGGWTRVRAALHPRECGTVVALAWGSM